MDSRERFYATINYEKTDRPASWLGLPVLRCRFSVLQPITLPVRLILPKFRTTRLRMNVL